MDRQNRPDLMVTQGDGLEAEPIRRSRETGSLKACDGFVQAASMHGTPACALHLIPDMLVLHCTVTRICHTSGVGDPQMVANR
jgi:hypothetical protein